jgi:lysyl-tRNA synthetase class 2
MTESAESLIIQQRREKKDRLHQAGKRPYGHRFERSMLLGKVHSEFGPRIPTGEGAPPPTDIPELTLAGRLMTRRDLGKLCFATISDYTAKLQIKLSKNEIGKEVLIYKDGQFRL